MLKLAKAKGFHQRRQINAEATAQTFFQTIPSTYRVGCAATSAFDGSFFARLLFVGTAQFDPAAGFLEHGMEIIDTAGS